MSYISLSEKDRKDILSLLGMSSIDELFRMIPDDIRPKKEIAVPDSLTEPELIQHFREIAQKNTFPQFLSFLGAGAYPHFIPTIVDVLSSRGEFVTPYTPYQPEVSQGTLQVIFEFQTLICQLTGMDVSNASLYDGASATAEAVLMAHRLKQKPKILVSRFLHPQYRETVKTYSKNLGISIIEIDHSENGEIDLEHLDEQMDEGTTAVVVQSPNFMGIVENIHEISEHAHSKGSLSITSVPEPISLGILEAPGNLGADIVTGEGQSFGIPLSFGGPHVGFMACAEEFLRQFPGRIAGQTSDVEGRRGFVLTLSAREQHIRREKATSNICTNQAWCALRATIFLETLGKEGMRELAWQNTQKAHYALERLSSLQGIDRKFSAEVFNEFVLEFEKPWPEIQEFLRKKRIIGGLDLKEYYPSLKNCALFCVTELHMKEEIDRLADALEEALDTL